MQTFLSITPLIMLITLGTLLAYRWVTHPSAKSKRTPYTIRLTALILVCWAGTLPVGFTSTYVSKKYFDPNDHPDDRGISADTVHDGVGNNVACIVFGWIVGPISIALASSLQTTDKSHTFKTEIT